MRGGRPAVGPAVRVFFVCFVVYAYFMPRWADWNIDSRIDLVHAIVDKHSLSIDAFHWNTWDKAVVDNHFYSDKAPGTAVLGAGVYAAFSAVRGIPPTASLIRNIERSSAWDSAISLGTLPKHASPAPGGRTPGGCKRAGFAGSTQTAPWGNRLIPPMRDWAFSKYAVTVGVVGLLSALFASFFFWFLGFFVAGTRLRWILTGLYAFATDALPYSTNLYSHQIAAGCIFTGFALLYLTRLGMATIRSSLVAGFLLGFALFTEYTVAVLAVFVGLYGLWVLKGRSTNIISFFVGGALPVLALFAYNTATFGSPLDTGYSHDFCWSAAQAAGYAGFTLPKSGPLFDLTFGSFRGLFYMSPFLLFALPGMVIMARRSLGLEAVLCFTASVTFILLLSAYWGWNGGKVIGPRYLVPIIPFLIFPGVFYIDYFRRSRIAIVLFTITALWSVFVVWSEFLGGALFPISWQRNPLVDYSLPALKRGDIAPNLGLFFGLSSWWTLLPLASFLLFLVLAQVSLSHGPRHRASRASSGRHAGNIR